MISINPQPQCAEPQLDNQEKTQLLYVRACSQFNMWNESNNLICGMKATVTYLYLTELHLR